MQVAKWGNSLAVRLPAKLVEQLGLKEGDNVELVAGEGGFVVTRTPDRLELLAEMRKYRGSRPKDYTFERDEAHDVRDTPPPYGTLDDAPATAPRGFHED